MSDAIRQKIDRQTGEANARHIMQLANDVKAGRITPENARQHAENAVRHSSDAVKQATTDAINQHLNRR